MKITDWKDVAELAGIAAIVGSLLFVGYQIKQEQGIAIADTYGGLVESTENIADLVDRNADLWRRGLDGEDLSEAEEIRFLVIAKAVQTHFSNFHIRWDWVGPVPPEIASRRYAYALYMHPGLRKAREQGRSVFSGGVVRGGTTTSSRFEGEVDKFLAEFEGQKAALPPEKIYVFW